MLTPAKVQALADPIESVYIHIVDELLVNIGKHITSPTWTHTASWEVQKLSEMGQLTAENAAIINKWIKQIQPEMRKTMEATRAAALDRIEQQLEQAAKAGYVTPPLRDSTVDVLRDMSDQAADKLNLVNTTMLQSSLDQYSRAVQLTEAEIKRAEATQGILNEAAASIATGAETRTQAVRRAILRISDEGLTGFIDKAGRSWTPEAYVNTVVRTTVHNTAIQSTKARMEDYGTEVFQISSHAGARPLCYPYQGWFCSWDNSSGEIELGDGRTVKYVPLRDTSYGEPAGIFGINCGHFPIPIIPGVTIPHGEDAIQPKEENDKAYAESQEQRRLEREIREAKRNVEMLGPAATAEDKAKVKALQKEMREFTERTGRMRRYDREQIGGTPQTTRTPKAAPAPKREAKSEVVQNAKAYGIADNPPSRLTTPRTTDEIITVVGGGDKTKGSCASCVLAYAGNEAGFDVRDYRGGKSQEYFSRRSTGRNIAKLEGVTGWTIERKNDFTAVHELLKHVEDGKEYGLYTGRHAAVIRKSATGYEYLELQSAYRNGFFPLTDGSLKNRFACQKSHSWAGNKYEISNTLIELSTLHGNVDFEALLGYINTEEGQQKKGASGSVK